MWYRAWADVGGSASKTIQSYYFWSKEVLSDDWKDDYWHQYFGYHSIYAECRPYGEVELIEELPEEIRLDKVAYYERQIKDAKYMLEKLECT